LAYHAYPLSFAGFGPLKRSNMLHHIEIMKMRKVQPNNRMCKPPLKSVHSEVEIFGQTNESQEIEDEEESVQ
jgi:hypothetical protein